MSFCTCLLASFSFTALVPAVEASTVPLSWSRTTISGLCGFVSTGEEARETHSLTGRVCRVSEGECVALDEVRGLGLIEVDREHELVKEPFSNRVRRSVLLLSLVCVDNTGVLYERYSR